MTLKELYQDKELLRELELFFHTCLVEQGVEKMFNRQPTDAIAEAKESLDAAFAKLDEMFEPKKQPMNFDNAR